MKILVAGHRGFVGKKTCQLLESRDHRIVGYDLVDNQDIRDKAQFDSAVAKHKPDRILLLAAIARFAEADADPRLAFETNVLGTRNVAEVCEKHQVPLVYASTGSVYMPIKQEPPITETFPACGNSVYGCTKYIGELYVKEHKPHVILRYSHLYGIEKIGQGLIGNFIERISRGLAPELYGGKQSNDFCYIKDVAEANYLALTATEDKWNQVYNIGSGEELSAKEAGQTLCDVIGYTGEIKVVSPREVDAKRFVYDISKAKKILGYEPKFSFKEGLNDMFRSKKPAVSKLLG